MLQVDRLSIQPEQNTQSEVLQETKGEAAAFYRMYKEKHTRTRYLQAAFLFPVRFIGERIFG